MRLRVLSSLLLLFFPACQLAAQATSNAQKFSPPHLSLHLQLHREGYSLRSEASARLGSGAAD